ncbi:MAG TPA: VapC toxin family PIN domain ribonuclease [Acidobacterium sp.]|nr:VapC toxin family PIN domain ribonuclease [Acidobacterium sp.]
MFWPSHVHHVRAQQWFSEHSRHGWATCPLTQTGFVRIVSNPAFSKSAVTARDAIHVLQENLKHRSHVFWADSVGVNEAASFTHDRLIGHKQVTDAYLIGLAHHHQGRLLTFDRGLGSLLPPALQKHSWIVCLS